MLSLLNGLFTCLLLIFILLPSSGNTLECYECTSDDGGSCGRKFNSSIGISQPCESGKDVCIKVTMQVTNNGYITMRQCTRADACNILKSKSCHLCSEDLCNSSRKLNSVFIINVFFFSITFIMYKTVY